MPTTLTDARSDRCAGCPPALLLQAGIGAWQAELPAGRWWPDDCAQQQFADAQGAVPADLPGLLAALHPADRSGLAAALQRLAEHGEPVTQDVRLAHGDGGWLRLNAVLDASAMPPRAVGLVQRRDEAAAVERTVLDALPDLWFVLSADGHYLEVSRADHLDLALPWAEVRGRHLADVLPGRVAELVMAALARARNDGRVERIEYHLGTVGGTERTFEGRIAALPDRRWLFLARDVTDAAEAQQALCDSEARLARAVRGTSDGLWEWDVRSGRDDLSPRWKELLGFAPHELADKEDSFFGRLHPDDVEPVRAAVQGHFLHGAPYDVELRLLTRDKQWRWFRSRGEVERGSDGQPARMAGSISDITVRKQMEDALRDSQARFSAMVHTAPVGILLTQVDDGVVVEANGEVGRFLGWPPGEMVGRNVFELGAWTDAAQRQAFIAHLRREGRAERAHLLMRRRDGSPAHAALASQLLPIGGRDLVLSAITDIGDRVAAEQALREQREAYGAIFEAASDAIISVDREGRVLLFNPGAERVFQRPAEAVRGQGLDRLLPASRRQRHRGDLAGFAESATSRRAMGAGRVKGLRADGQELDLEASISKAEVGGQIVLTAILRDVTERVQAEADALRHRSELSALTRALLEQEKHTTQRLAQALHDQLGQTLTALRLAMDRDRRTPPADPADAAQRHAHTEGLIDQALQPVRRVLIDLLLESPQALHVQRWPGEVECAMFMIGREALDNALRHADASLVRIALSGDAGLLRLEVADDGVGLAPDATRSRPRHLGLIGMRERARAIGASLELTPAPGGGTCVGTLWRLPT